MPHLVVKPLSEFGITQEAREPFDGNELGQLGDSLMARQIESKTPQAGSRPIEAPRVSQNTELPAASPRPAEPPTRECLFARIPRLDRFLRKRGFGELVAAQATMKTVLIGLSRLDDGRAYSLPHRRAWLYRVALWQALRIARTELRCVNLGDLDAEAARDADYDEERNAVLKKAIDAALLTLSSQQRQAAELHLLRGYSMRHAAAKMGVEVATFRVHLKRGLDRLRDELQHFDRFPVARGTL